MCYSFFIGKCGEILTIVKAFFSKKLPRSFLIQPNTLEEGRKIAISLS